MRNVSPARKVVIIDRRDIPLVVHHPLQVAIPIVGIAVHPGSAEHHFRYPVEHIIGIVDLKPISILGSGEQAAANVICVLGKDGIVLTL